MGQIRKLWPQVEIRLSKRHTAKHMKLLRVSLTVVLGTLTLVIAVPTTFAQASLGPSSSSDASAYQPPTDNPQADVSTNLQNTSSSLQPVPGQTGVNQQTLGGRSDLQVAGTTGKPNPNTTSTVVTASEDSPTNPLWYVVVGLVAVGGGMYLARKRAKSSSDTTIDAAEPEAIAIKPEPLPLPKKHKNPAGKKRSTKKRKTRR